MNETLRIDEGVTADMGIIIVNNMLLTGFDAPMYRCTISTIGSL